MNIFEKMLGITSELSRVAKNLEVGYGQSKYKATGEADVLSAIKPLEAQYKIYSYPVKREILETGELETKNGAKNLFLRIATTYRFVNVEKPEEFIEITSYGDGVDSQDKSVGKAMTYSDKYALMKAYKIITGDDPDQNMSEELKNKNTRPKEQPSVKAFKEQQATEPADNNKAVEGQETDWREELKKFLNYNPAEIRKVSMEFGLTNKSKMSDFENVCKYLKGAKNAG